MILLSKDCLLFRLSSGEYVPLRPEMISFEVSGGKDSPLEADIVNHAAAAVFHYFKTDLGRDSVTIGEFALVLAKVLEVLGNVARAVDLKGAAGGVTETNLQLLADQTGRNELLFFAGLRRELRAGLRQSPSVLRFRGLRACVRQLSGSRRWNLRCQNLRDQIVEYLRACLKADASDKSCSLIVD